ncbi:AAA domain-containing protein [Enterococcus durans]|uniref:AAA domain-containing protein n=1 Tax=Enterococcus durans TaxID=53345 RepID=A0A5N0YTA4_9ENTE|nr:AAA family ATPase [Enterococcus durans]KAA9180169.1 AAA domain-containing protein [Enterococcus durans]KAA9187295.1 AAA domain-containing protein [Enterococcus durans]KAA9187464.1 AAA domain-containing protein [Enterococcus durans]KAA9192375.1 AAA domain-containing protein [Enterococcus durans]KAA9194594.1 AAA domain-containing protein [Enterococcus durans]
MDNFSLTDHRSFSTIERQMIWQKPASHRTSSVELRIAAEIKENWEDPEMKISNILLEGDAGSGKTQLAKALSADLQLPYTKVTCFADMDKSDVFGALLPVVDSDEEEDQALIDAINQTDTLNAVLKVIKDHYKVNDELAKQKLADFVQRIDEQKSETVRYKYYPSEIVRAIEKGYLLEIQEPTVIRDASVLVALNSALEPNGLLNLPTGVVPRHADCVIIITTNRNYQGNRPLNESLRDRMQHAEKMDLPTLEVMVERAIGKTNIQEPELLAKMAEIIRLLDETAKANAIKGVAGMRSYFYWANTWKQGQDVLESLYPKVLYKLTTDPEELKILIQRLEDSGLLEELRTLIQLQKWGKPSEVQTSARGRVLTAEEADQRNIDQLEETFSLSESEKKIETENEATEKALEKEPTELQEVTLPVSQEERVEDVEGKSQDDQDQAEDISNKMSASDMEAHDKEIKRELNKEARQAMKGTIHEKEGLIIHRPTFTPNDPEARKLRKQVLPVVDSLSRQILDLLENDESATYQKSKYEGQRFDASRVAYGDLRNFDKKNPPHEQPSLAVAIRVDESGSMIRDDRIEAAKKATIAVAEFAQRVNIPLMIYGDTADVSARGKTSLFSYKEFSDDFSWLTDKLVTMKARQNNRDGATLRIVATKLSQQATTTKLMLVISDGQPKALPDYTGKKAKQDIQEVLSEFERQGVVFVSAAIGQDKEEIKEIYGENRFLDITDLNEFPKQLIQLISRYL